MSDLQNTRTDEVKQMATQLLAGLLANRHIYASMSDEGGKGQQEQKLVLVAIELAESLIDAVEKRHD